MADTDFFGVTDNWFETLPNLISFPTTSPIIIFLII